MLKTRSNWLACSPVSVGHSEKMCGLGYRQQSTPWFLRRSVLGIEGSHSIAERRGPEDLQDLVMKLGMEIVRLAGVADQRFRKTNGFEKPLMRHCTAEA